MMRAQKELLLCWKIQILLELEVMLLVIIIYLLVNTECSE